MRPFFRDLLLRCARSERASLQLFADRGVHQLLRWTLPRLFGELASSPGLRALDATMRVPVIRGHEPSDGDGFQPLPVLAGAAHWPTAVRLPTVTPRPGLPLVVWHHGAGEFPVDASIANAYQVTPALRAPLAIVRAPGHDAFRRYTEQMRTGHGAGGMLVASAHAVEALRRWWPGPVLVAGLSLGGMVTLLHAHRFGAAALAEGRALRWAPVAAGPDFAGAITDSGFARLASGETVRATVLGQRLALPGPGFDAAVSARIDPLLGLWDLVHRFRHQFAAYAHIGVRPQVVKRGHIGLSVDGMAIGAHLCAALERLAGEPDPAPA